MTWRVPGDIPLVSTSRIDNGISAKVGFPEGSDYVTHSNIITVAYSGSVGATFYHEDLVFVGETVMGLLPIRDTTLTQATGLFLAAVIEASVSHFTYEQKLKVSDMRERILIPLPVTSNGVPDWDFMERTMHEVFAQQEHELDKVSSLAKSVPQAVSNQTWREFLIGDLFDVVKGTRLTKSNMRPGTIRYIGASQFDNGVTAMISNDEAVHPGNLITVCYDGPVGTTFYQPEKFWATDAVNVLYPRFDLNEMIGLFLAPVIQEAGSAFDYGQKWGAELMRSTSICLPVISGGTPDWDYMEQAMQNIMAERETALESLQTLAVEPA